MKKIITAIITVLAITGVFTVVGLFLGILSSLGYSFIMWEFEGFLWGMIRFYIAVTTMVGLFVAVPFIIQDWENL